MELAVRILVRLLDPLDILDDLQRLDEVDVNAGGVAHQPQDGLTHPLRLVDGHPLACQPLLEVAELPGIRILS